MNPRVMPFDSAKIGQNIMWDHPLSSIQNQQYSHSVKAKAKTQMIKKESPQKQESEVNKVNETEDIMNLEDVWNAIEEKQTEQNSVKVEIMSISNEPVELTLEQFEEVFGNSSPNKKQTETENINIVEDAEDFCDLWQQVNETTQQKVSLPTVEIKEQLIVSEQKPTKQSQFYEVDEKEGVSKGKTCLTLGKNFQIYDLSAFLVNCFEHTTYSYFGFSEPKPNIYEIYDISTKQILISCAIEKYEQFEEKTAGKKIVFQKDYCLKFRLPNGQLLATMWKKSICNGIFFNLRHYNIYEKKYDDCLALIEVADGYLGQFCYCNTTAHLSQKYTKQSGPFKMKLSLKNGYLISHMGVSGIISAPYNCRLQSPSDSFVYLLGLIEKQNQNFLMRVGEGMSPLVAFAISVGRKRYIDSFKQ